MQRNVKKLVDNNNVQVFNLSKEEVNESVLAELKSNLSDIVHRIVVPNTFNLFTSILSYSVIAITSSFDSIRIFSIYLSI